MLHERLHEVMICEKYGLQRNESKVNNLDFLVLVIFHVGHKDECGTCYFPLNRNHKFNLNKTSGNRHF